MSNIVYSDVWQQVDAQVQADAIAMWRGLRALPPGTEEDRTKSLCIVAYVGADLIGVSTIGLRQVDLVRSRFGFFRCLVVPEYRQQSVATELAVRCLKALAAWSEENPQENVKGMGAIIESALLTEKSRQPVWPKTGLTVVGYTPKGEQIRLAWFKHARL